MTSTTALGPATDTALFRKNGFAIVPDVLDPEDVARLRIAIDAIPDSDAVRKRRGVYGVRNLLGISSEIRELAARAEIRRLVTPLLGEKAFATRAVFFDKVPDANWSLGWHQDSVIAVTERREVPGFIAWGLKAGVWQVQPPPDILAKMVAVRVHLDDCGSENGPLRVLPGSHRHGWIEDRIAEWKQTVPAVECVVPAGGVVLMCPLLLHASSKADSPNHRRVVHIEYATQTLPGGLDWHQRV
ncbi:MAG: phytanoyl-CoA dioxygenase family protein [Planctomycetaceae bacterium]